MATWAHVCGPSDLEFITRPIFDWLKILLQTSVMDLDNFPQGNMWVPYTPCVTMAISHPMPLRRAWPASLQTKLYQLLTALPLACRGVTTVAVLLHIVHMPIIVAAQLMYACMHISIYMYLCIYIYVCVCDMIYIPPDRSPAHDFRKTMFSLFQENDVFPIAACMFHVQNDHHKKSLNSDGSLTLIGFCVQKGCELKSRLFHSIES